MARTRKREKGKISGLKGDGKPNAYWRRFKERLDRYTDVPVENWKDEQVLGHILQRYRDQMKMEFALSYSGPPTKCKEIYCVRRMMLALGTDQGDLFKKYVDWVFDTVILPGKVTVSSIAYFFTTALILRFKHELRKQARISRASILPLELQSVVDSLSLDVRTYGDLAVARVAIADDPNNKALEAYSLLFTRLRDAGFDDSVLNSLEG